MTKLKEAQKREDMLLDLYKFHAYIPNDAMGNTLTSFGNFCEGYEAAHAINAKRIAELEELLDEQRGAIRGLNMCIGGEDSLTTNNLRRCRDYLDDEKCLFDVIAELETQNKAMHEALEKVEYSVSMVLSQHNQGASILEVNEMSLLVRAVNITKQALALDKKG